jgi:RHS repeat-associated protein
MNGTATTYLVRSLHGDVVGTAASGTVSSPVAYDPWGAIRTGTAGSKLGYQGDPTDAATGMVNMQHRLYVPGLGRFASQDTVFGQLASPASLNQFIYGEQNPVTMSDPTGMGIVDSKGHVVGTGSPVESSGVSNTTGHSCHTRCGDGGTDPVGTGVTVYSTTTSGYTPSYDFFYTSSLSISHEGWLPFDIDADLRNAALSSSVGLEFASRVAKLRTLGHGFSASIGVIAQAGSDGLGVGFSKTVTVDGLQVSVHDSLGVNRQGFAVDTRTYSVSGEALRGASVTYTQKVGIRYHDPGWAADLELVGVVYVAPFVGVTAGGAALVGAGAEETIATTIEVVQQLDEAA